jgi:deazaflavin-dependent oxidoreductase (nitroreductase family)
MALGCTAAYVSSALRTEAGRKQLLPVLRPLMRVINPRVVHAVEMGKSSYCVVHHIGRRSGVAYETPVDVARMLEGVLISLPYGPDTDWCRNLVAAQHCTLTVNGEELALSTPEVLGAEHAEAGLSAEKLRQWRGEGIRHYLSLRYAASVQSEAASRPTATSATSA